MGSIYTTEERIERIEHQLGINDASKISSVDFIDTVNQADLLDDQIDDLKRRVKDLRTTVKAIQHIADKIDLRNLESRTINLDGKVYKLEEVLKNLKIVVS